MLERLTQCRGGPAIGFFLLLCTILYSCTVQAQQLAVVSYTSAEGPAHPQVWSVYHDSRDYLWVGTSEGLSRWDGVEFLSFTAADGLPDLTVRNILEDDDGTLWLGTDGGVVVYDGRRLESLDGDQGRANGTVWCSAKDNNNRLWFGTHLGGVAVWTDSGFRHFDQDSGLGSNYVYSMLIDSADNIWLGHRGAGLTRCRIEEPLDLAQCRTFTSSDGLAHDEVRALIEDSDGRVWIGTRGGGVSRWDGSGFVNFSREHGLASNDIYAMLINDHDQLVVGTVRHGITTCDLPNLSGCRSFGMRNGFSDDGVLTLALGHDRTLWVGLSNGLSHLWTESVESYTLADGLPHRTVYAVHADPDGTVWVGTLDGIARISPRDDDPSTTRVTGWKSENILPGYEVWDFCRDVKGRLWAATERGMCHFENGRCVTVLTHDDGLADSDLITVISAHDGALWVGTVNGASRLRFGEDGDALEVMNLSVDDGLAGPFVNAIAEDSRAEIWLGTDGGLSRWDGRRLLTYTVADGLPVGEIMAILADREGQLWLGTNGGGFVQVRTAGQRPVFEVHGNEHGIPEVVSALIDAGDGTLWLGTGEGALLYEPKQRRILERVDVHSGLPGSEVDVFRLDYSGALWIGSSGGATRVEIGGEREAPAAPRVTIERARTLSGAEWRLPFSSPTANRDPGVRWFDQSPMQLEHDFAALRVEFRALAFGPREIRYQVLLEGFDRDWSPPFTTAFKEYTNLDPGSYTMQVRAASLGGDWSSPATLDFAVIPAWWQTAWARVGSVLLVFFAALAAVRHRLSRIVRRTDELERAVAERTDDLRRYARALEEHSGALDRANVRIRHADRVKSEFLANMSHELRTPLNSIIGFSEVLAQRLADTLNEMELRFLNNVSRSGRYLLLLINNLLDLSKIEADRMDLHLEKVELAPVVDDTLRVVQGYASDRSVAIRLEAAPEVAEVEVDVAKLNQILINLLSNAVKFSAKGGEVKVEVRSVSAEVSDLGVLSYELAVTDTGPGVRDEDRNVIFEVFRQGGAGTDHPGGTGLGLALVQRFVILLSGKVGFTSTPGKSTTFRVLLPVHPSGNRTEAIDGISDPLHTEALNRPCVLVIEGQREHFSALARAMDARGLLPVRAGDFDEAQRMTDGLRPVALVLRWDGRASRVWTELATLCAEPHGLPVVATARIGSTGPVAVGADASILHPAEPSQVVAVVRDMGIEHGATIDLCGCEGSTAEAISAALTNAGFEVSGHANADVLVLDFSCPRPEPVLARAAAAVPEQHLVVLFPPELPPGFELLDGSSGPSVDEIAKVVRDLLDRQIRDPSRVLRLLDRHG